MATEWGLGCEC